MEPESINCIEDCMENIPVTPKLQCGARGRGTEIDVPGVAPYMGKTCVCMNEPLGKEVFENDGDVEPAVVEGEGAGDNVRMPDEVKSATTMLYRAVSMATKAHTYPTSATK